MAKKVSVTVVDDLDETKTADETIVFSLDGINYEIDLCAKNAKNLRTTMENWAKHSRPVRGKKRKQSKRTIIATQAPAGVIRDWANNNGYTLKSRGRVPTEIVEAFRASH